MTKIDWGATLFANYNTSQSWNIDDICEGLGIEPADITDYWVKRDTLTIGYKRDGETHQAEYEGDCQDLLKYPYDIDIEYI